MRLTFQLNWIFQGPNSPFLHAVDAGYLDPLGVTLDFVTGQSSSIVAGAIAAATADLGFGDIPSAVEAHLRDPARAPVCLMPIYARSPAALAHIDRGLPLTLAGLAGKRLAGPPADTAARLLPLVLRLNGLEGLAFDYAVVTPEARDRGLADGSLDAVTCFDSTVLFSMRSRGLATDALRFLYLADCGLDVYSAALLAGPTVTAAPDLSAGLADAFARAWEDCRRDPGLGVAAVLRRLPEADPVQTRGHLQWVLDHQVFPAGAAAMGSIDPAKAALSVAAGRHLAGRHLAGAEPVEADALTARLFPRDGRWRA